MAENTIKTRIQMKNDTAENWDKATGFIPKAGEIIIYNVDADHTEPRLKVGDGATAVTALPFTDEEITPADVDAICGALIYSAEEVEL